MSLPLCIIHSIIGLKYKLEKARLCMIWWKLKGCIGFIVKKEPFAISTLGIQYSKTPLLRPPIDLRKNGLYIGGGLTIELR